MRKPYAVQSGWTDGYAKGSPMNDALGVDNQKHERSVPLFILWGVT